MKFLKCSGLIFLSCLALYILARQPIWDESPVPDQDLAIIENSVPDTENLHTAITSIASRLSTTTEATISELVAMQDDTNRDEVSFNRLISATDKFVQVYLRDAQDKKYDCPAQEECHLSLIRNLGFVLALHADSYASRGELAKAKELLGSGFHLAHALSSDTSINSIQLLVALGIGNMHVETAKKHALVYEQAELSIITPGVLQYVLQDEYQLFKVVISNGTSNYWQQPQRTVNEIADFTRKSILYSIVACDISPSPELLEDLNNFIQSRKTQSSQLWRPNWLGTTQQSIWFTSVGPSLRTKVCAYNQSLKAI